MKSLPIVLLLAFTSPIYAADDLLDLDGLADIGDSSSSNTPSLDALSDDSSLDALGSANNSPSTDLPEITSSNNGTAANSIQFNGYIKPLSYWGSRTFSDDAWKTLLDLYADGITIPGPQSYSGFAATGSRVQLRAEGYLGTKARVFTAMNFDYNEVSGGSTSNRLIESYVELFGDNSTWKVGNQLITWGFMEGIEVPTDRINAFDYEYASTEYEDSKMASTAIVYQHSLGDFSGIDVVLIPTSKVNNDSPDEDRLFSQNSDILPAKNSDNVKTALRYFNTVGNLDFALSYVEGTDPRADATLLGTSPTNTLQRTYNREKSPGLDLQYNFGSVLGKLAYAQHITNDSTGNNASIKNSWHHLAIGAEFNIDSTIVNLYTGTKVVDDFNDSTNDRNTTNLLMRQTYSQVNFISGHVSANFLTGDALSTTILFAGYWNPKGQMIQYIVKPTLGYKLVDSLQLMFSPSIMDANDTSYKSVQLELKYSF